MLIENLLPQVRQRLVTVLDGVSLIEAAKLLRVGTDIVLVCDAAGILAGVITKTDVVSQISHCQGASCVTPVSLVMTRSVITCDRRDSLHGVWMVMKQRQLKNIPVIDSETKPIGVLNARDALDALLGEVENEEVLLRDYVMGVGYQ
ncbi:MAG TPA: CBS domain-containing protein [Pseudolabrys sp.]|jgi:CBS domain-containing protein|nr:CBS domain-containing protein [Pseudolabrys sp.]